MVSMARRRRFEPRIFFPWEGRGGIAHTLRLARVRPLLLVLLVVSFLLWVGFRERRLAGVRLTRATIESTRRAVDRYRAEHNGACPPNLAALVLPGKPGKSGTEPLDAWGQRLRFICPGHRDNSSYELISDGPDGLAGGLDRIE